jgi:hypothetical protein
MSAFDINSDDIVKNFKYSRNISGNDSKVHIAKEISKDSGGN